MPKRGQGGDSDRKKGGGQDQRRANKTTEEAIPVLSWCVTIPLEKRVMKKAKERPMSVKNGAECRKPSESRAWWY